VVGDTLAAVKTAEGLFRAQGIFDADALGSPSAYNVAWDNFEKLVEPLDMARSLQSVPHPDTHLVNTRISSCF
jgi:hypothetical protein